MFIVLKASRYALRRSAMCFGGLPSHSAPNGAGYISIGIYKHVAPLEQKPNLSSGAKPNLLLHEQEPSMPTITTFLQR